MGEPEDPCKLVSFIRSDVLGRVPLFPDGDKHEPQQHGVGDAQDGVDEACNVVVLLAPLGGDQALHQHQPSNCNYRRYSDNHEAGEDAHYWEPPSRAGLLLGSILWAMKEHDAKCRSQARTSEKAQNSGSPTSENSENSVNANFREIVKSEVQLRRIPKRRSSQNSYSTHLDE